MIIKTIPCKGICYYSAMTNIPPGIISVCQTSDLISQSNKPFELTFI